MNRWFDRHPAIAAASLLVVVGLTTTMLWAIFHLRKLQEELEESIDVSYGGKGWGLGRLWRLCYSYR